MLAKNLLLKYDNSFTASGLLRMDIDVEESKEMPLVWLLAETLLYLWGVRSSGKSADLLSTRSFLKSKMNILRETRLANQHLMISEIFGSS